MLKRQGRVARVVGLFAIAIAAAIWTPDPSGTGLFDPYITVPLPLDHILVERGLEVRGHALNTVANDAYFGTKFLIAVPLAWLALIQLVVKRRWMRTVAYLVTPILLVVTFPNSYAGKLEDPPIQAMPEKAISSRAGSQHTEKSSSNGDPYIFGYLLKPHDLTPKLSEQARYVLAQRAYFDDDPVAAALHLSHIGNEWRPSDPHERVRIIMIGRWTSLHGSDPGAFVNRLIGWSIGGHLSRFFSPLLGLIGALLLIAGGIVSAQGRNRHTFLKRKNLTAPAT